MSRATLVVTLTVVMVSMMVLAVGSAVAKPDPGKDVYTQTVSGVQYAAIPPSDATGGVGIARFRGAVSGDPAVVMDATLRYTGYPDENVTAEIVGGTWTITGPDTSLTGTWRGGTAKWDEGAGYALVGPPGGPLVPVYAGVADVKATMGVTGGTVEGVPVKGGSGKFEGLIDHHPLQEDPQRPPTVSGDMTLKF